MDIKKGRPPIAKKRSRLLITLADDDIAVLKAFAEVTGTTPSTFIREIVQTALPDIKMLTEAAVEAQSSTNKNVLNKGGAMLAKYIKEAAELQEDLFNDK
ncbi:MAG: hypothetical protein Q9M18_08755 [Mariprofundaceae bacterium]|nr:hypothetical protein [Mariprofundaceae bacterium]